MSTRRNRFLWRSFRAFVYSLIFTILVAMAVSFLVGPRYDASTLFGPTDQAMRQVVDAGNEAGQRSKLTNNERSQEARRIAYGASNRQNIGRALYHLASAPILRQELQISEIDTKDGVNNDHVKKVVENRINEIRPGIDVRTWRPKDGYREDAEDGEGDAGIVEIQNRSGIPLGLWAEFVYLDLTLDHHNLSREILRPDSLPRTVRSLRVSPELAGPRDIVLSVRHRDPRMAEVLANAITATYKHQYDSDHVDGAVKQLQFHRDRQVMAARQYAAARNTFAQWLRLNSRSLSAAGTDMNKVPSNPMELEAQAFQRACDSSGEALNEASRSFRRAEEEFRKADDTGALVVACWAGMSPGTPGRPESPAHVSATKRNIVLLTFVFLLGFVGNLGLSYALGAFRRDVAEIRNRPAETAKTEPTAVEPQEEPPAVEPVAESEDRNDF